MRPGRGWIIPAVLGLAACTTSPSETLLARHGDRNTVAAFTICHGFGCLRDTVVSLSGDEWGQVRSVFSGEPRDAAEERQRIRAAVAKFENLVGPKTETENDDPGAAIVALDTRGQMDCIDEAYNTSTYLGLLAQEGLLRFHIVGRPALRGRLINGWPHNTATVIETASGDGFAVDSWFHRNGQPPELVPLDIWLAGWSPEKSSAPIT